MSILNMLKNNRSLICTVAAIIGVPITAYFSMRAGAKMRECVTKKDIARTCAPAAAAGLATVAAICLERKFTSDELAAAAKKAAISAASCAVLKNQFDRYQQANIKANGIEAHNEAMATVIPPAPIDNSNDGQVYLWYEPESDQEFEMTEAEFFNARYKLNQEFIKNERITFADWLVILKLKAEPWSARRGWSSYSELVYGYRWIDVEWHDVYLDDGRKARELVYPVDPHEDFEAPELL